MSNDTATPATLHAATTATGTDLTRFVADEARRAAVQAITAKIRRLGIKHVLYQFVSVTGRVMGKAAPAPHWPTVAERGVQLWYGAVADVCTDRQGNYIGYGANASELVALPDPETFCQLPWNPRVARVFCTLFRNREDAEDAGAFLTSDSRGNLRRIHADFQTRHGMHLRVGCEPEMMWLKRGPDGKSAGGTTRPFAYHIEQFEQLFPVIEKVTTYAQAMGLDMIQGDHEDAPGQLELNFNFDRAEVTADNLTTYRQICKQVGREMDAFPCFMPKPFMGVSANGCHHNISIWKGDENMFDAPDPSNPMMPGDIGLWAIGGILKHLGALTAISSPTVNSYRRLWDTGFWAPVFADWGFQNRTTALRISAPGRFEYRSVDSAVNPYLSLTCLIAAMRDGIDNKIDPGQPEERNIYDAMNAGKEVKKIPMTLGEALDALDSDDVIKGALPGDMYRVFSHYKRDEWERYCATVTEWDVQEYLDILP